MPRAISATMPCEIVREPHPWGPLFPAPEFPDIQQFTMVITLPAAAVDYLQNRKELVANLNAYRLLSSGVTCCILAAQGGTHLLRFLIALGGDYSRAWLRQAIADEAFWITLKCDAPERSARLLVKTSPSDRESREWKAESLDGFRHGNPQRTLNEVRREFEEVVDQLRLARPTPVIAGTRIRRGWFSAYFDYTGDPRIAATMPGF